MQCNTSWGDPSFCAAVPATISRGGGLVRPGSTAADTERRRGGESGSSAVAERRAATRARSCTVLWWSALWCAVMCCSALYCTVLAVCLVTVLPVGEGGRYSGGGGSCGAPHCNT